MLRWRLFVSLLIIPALIGLFYLDAQSGPAAPYLLALTLLIGFRCVWELNELLRTRSFQPNLWLVTLCTTAVIGSNWYQRFRASPGETELGVAALGPEMLAYALSVLLLFFAAAMRYRRPGGNMESLAAELMIVGYVGVLLGVTAQLRWVAGADMGYFALGSLIIAAKFSDIGGYTLGRLFGKRKLIERLSPGKTWMGAWGALLGASLASWVWFQWGRLLFTPHSTPCAWYWSVLFGIVIGTVGLIGDLCESLIKRDLGKKDSAELLPGFGGLLDLLDSVIFAGPVAYALWLILPLQPQ